MMSAGKSSEMLAKLCDSFQRSVVTKDFNFDGQADHLVKLIYDQRECEGRKPDVSLELIEEGEILPIAPQEFIDGHFTPGSTIFDAQTWLREAHRFKAAGKARGTLFSTRDLVETPFGPRDQKMKVRIQRFFFEFDSQLHHTRNLAEVRTPYGWDYFELSALTLVAPLTDLDKRADQLIDAFRKTKTFQRREELLHYVNHPSNLKASFQDENAELEKRLALAFKEKIATLDLDPEGKEILLDKVGKKLEFGFIATSLALK